MENDAGLHQIMPWLSPGEQCARTRMGMTFGNLE
jgi:hypothetical protein